MEWETTKYWMNSIVHISVLVAWLSIFTKIIVFFVAGSITDIKKIWKNKDGKSNSNQ